MRAWISGILLVAMGLLGGDPAWGQAGRADGILCDTSATRWAGTADMSGGRMSVEACLEALLQRVNALDGGSIGGSLGVDPDGSGRIRWDEVLGEASGVARVEDLKADHGAAADGVKDDSQPLVDAIAAADSDAAVVYVPRGTYKLGTWTTQNPTNLRMWCQRGAIIDLSFDADELAEDMGGTVDIRGCHFRNAKRSIFRWGTANDGADLLRVWDTTFESVGTLSATRAAIQADVVDTAFGAIDIRNTEATGWGSQLLDFSDATALPSWQSFHIVSSGCRQGRGVSCIGIHGDGPAVLASGIFCRHYNGERCFAMGSPAMIVGAQCESIWYSDGNHDGCLHTQEAHPSGQVLTVGLEAIDSTQDNAEAVVLHKNTTATRIQDIGTKILLTGHEGVDAAADVDAGADTITIASHGWANGEGPVEVALESGSLPGGLAESTRYYVVVVDADTIQLAATAAAAWPECMNRSTDEDGEADGDDYPNDPDCTGFTDYSEATAGTQTAADAGKVVDITSTPVGSFTVTRKGAGKGIRIATSDVQIVGAQIDGTHIGIQVDADTANVQLAQLDVSVEGTESKPIGLYLKGGDFHRISGGRVRAAQGWWGAAGFAAGLARAIDTECQDADGVSEGLTLRDLSLRAEEADMTSTSLAVGVRLHSAAAANCDTRRSTLDGLTMERVGIGIWPGATATEQLEDLEIRDLRSHDHASLFSNLDDANVVGEIVEHRDPSAASQHFGASGSPACWILRDDDDGGDTACHVLNGSLVCEADTNGVCNDGT